MIQSNRGFFEVSDDGVGAIISALPKGRIIGRDTILSLVGRHTEDDAGEVIDYLENTLGIVTPTELSEASVSFRSPSPRLVDVAQRAFDGLLTDDTIQSASSIRVVVFDGTADEDVLRTEMDDLRLGGRLVTAFQVRDVFVVTSVWSPSSGLPCPLCNVDFALDRVFFDPKDAVMGLSDVYDLTRSLGSREPHIPVNDSDLAFTLRFVRQHTDALGGTGFASFSPFDPVLTSVVNISRLDRQTVRVPLSPLCDCIHKYPVAGGRGLA